MRRLLLMLLVLPTVAQGWPAAWIHPGLSGDVTLSPGPKGSLLDPGLAVRAASTDLRWYGVPVGDVEAVFEVPLWRPAVHLGATSAGGPVDRLALAASVPTREDGVYDLSLEVASLRALDGEISGSVSLRGAREAPRLEVDVQAKGISWGGAPLGDLVIKGSHAADRLQARVDWADAGGPVGYAELSLPVRVDPKAIAELRPEFEWLPELEHRVEVRANGLNRARVLPFWRAPLAARFQADLSVDLYGHLDKFVGAARLEGTLHRGAAPFSGVLHLRPQTQRVGAWIGKDALAAEAEIAADLPALHRGESDWDEAPVKGTVRADIRLGTLAPYLPHALVQPGGKIEGLVNLSGSLADPVATGEYTLSDGALTLVDMTVRLSQAAARIVLAGSTLEVRDFIGRVGPLGVVTGQAGFALQATPRGEDVALWSAWDLAGDAAIQVADFPVIHPFLPNGLFAGKLGVSLDAGPERTAVELAVREGRLALTERALRPARPIPRNRNVQAADGARTETASYDDDTVQVRLTVVDPVQVEGPEVSLRVGGDVQVERAGPDVRVVGGLEVAQAGTFTLFDNPFVVDRGWLTVAEGDLRESVAGAAGNLKLQDPNAPAEAAALDPIVDFTAHGTVTDTDIRLGVHGPARQPSLSLTSDPPLSEYQLLSLLITGRVDAVDGRGGDVRRRAAQVLDRFHNPGLARQVNDRLGVDKLGLAFGGVDQPIVTVGKQLHRQLYVETTYHHNAPRFENEKEVRLEYLLNPRWSVDTTYGDAAQGSVGLFWQRTFGQPSRP